MANNSIPTVPRPFVWASNVIGANFYVTLPKTPKLELLALGMEIYQKQMEHDFAIIHLKGKPYKLETQIHYNDPIVITYQSGKTKSTFNGYVNAVRQVNTVKGTSETIIEVIGASSVLKETAQKVYTKATADQVVSQICSKFSLSAVVQRDARVRNAIVHSGQSHWQLLRSLALQTGHALRCENTNLTFVSKDKITLTKKASAPYFVYIDNPNGGVVSEALRNLGSILNFSPIISDGSPETHSNVDRVITGRTTSNSNAKGKAIKTTHSKAAKGKGKSSQKPSKGAVKPSKDFFKKK
jgi:hypothetical protein